MKTFILEGVCIALSSISHNGGERNGTIVQLSVRNLFNLKAML